MKQSYLVVFLATITLAFGLVLAQQDDEGAIDDLRQQWEDLYNEGDIEGVAELYTEDAIFYGADGRIYEGRDAIQEGVQEQLDMGFTQVSIEATETEILNDTAYEIGRWTTTTGDGEMAIEGYYLVIFQRENGEWRAYRHFSNMILPEDWMQMEENGTGN